MTIHKITPIRDIDTHLVVVGGADNDFAAFRCRLQEIA